MANPEQYLPIVQRAFSVLRQWDFIACNDLTMPGDFFDFECYGSDFKHPKYGYGCWCHTVTYEPEFNSWYGTRWFNKQDGDHQYYESMGPKKSTIKSVLLAMIESGFFEQKLLDVKCFNCNDTGSVKVDFSINGFRYDPCPECNRKPCPDCIDSVVPGKIVTNPDWPNGDLPYLTSCDTCSGGGEVEVGD